MNVGTYFESLLWHFYPLFSCRCAETWLNLTADVSSNGHLKCKSVLYNEIAQECSLNQGDHNGKYDLIYDKLSGKKLIDQRRR